jgi:hypothetical protein
MILMFVLYVIKNHPVYTHKYIFIAFTNTGVPLYQQVIHSKTYRSYVKPQIIPNAIYNMIFM